MIVIGETGRGRVEKSDWERVRLTESVSRVRLGDLESQTGVLEKRSRNRRVKWEGESD